MSFAGFKEWLWRTAGVRYGIERVMCPHCGGMYSYNITMRDGGQVVTCYSCHRNFRLRVHIGQVIGVERQE
jgi:hypothetical protein